MNTSTLETTPRAREVVVGSTELVVHLKDGRTVSTPLNWFPRLLCATPEERRNFELIGEGEGIHWPDADEDLSVAGLLRGVRAPSIRASPSQSGVSRRQRKTELGDPLKMLSAREYQVFSLMATGIRTKEIAARLAVSPKTVDTYRASMMKKLDIHDVAGLRRFASQRDRTSAAR
jgi:DNA-binding CsgD family transcriptional regulator